MAKKQDLKSLVGGVLEADVNTRAREVERHVDDMAPAPVASTVLKLPLDRIYPDPDQPRRTFPEESLEELAASIREQGVLEPIQVIAADEGYQLLHGERRWRAAQMAGLSWIPAIIYEQTLSDADRLTRQLIENIQREDLNDVDRATALERLKELLDATWSEVAEKVGLTVGRIHQLRRLSKLAPDLQEAVRAGELSEKDSRPYQGLTARQQLALFRTGREENLDSDVVKEVARRLKQRPEPDEEKEADEDVTEAIQEIELEQKQAQERARARTRQQPSVPEAPPTAPQAPPPPSEEAPSVPEQEQPPMRTEPQPLAARAEAETTTKDAVIETRQRVETPVETKIAPRPVAESIPEDLEPYDDVETDRLLSHLQDVVEEVSQQLTLVIQALRRRPLASWEQERIEKDLSQLQDTLVQLQREQPDEASG